DFTPLVHKLRELNKRVIGVGIKESTSRLLPPACDEFLYYEALEGVDVPAERRRRGRKQGAGRQAGDQRSAPSVAEPVGEIEEEEADGAAPLSEDQLAIVIAQTVAGLEQSSTGPVLASSVKRALLRKDPTFSEADHGFRAFGELLRHLAERNVIELGEGSAKGDPEVTLPSQGAETDAFELLRDVVADLRSQGAVQLSGLKNRVRKVRPDFSEKKYGYRGFLQFCRAAATQEIVTLEWDDEAEDYLVSIP
ncbi:MAG TPA: OST-HTH/LOTUS domain-containing protein, partial [Actinomycetota bacterium]|nr:OST-HTH/LOTUS domain-containing protein [Actinomycetota bacterium]